MTTAARGGAARLVRLHAPRQCLRQRAGWRAALRPCARTSRRLLRVSGNRKGDARSCSALSLLAIVAGWPCLFRPRLPYSAAFGVALLGVDRANHVNGAYHNAKQCCGPNDRSIRTLLAIVVSASRMASRFNRKQWHTHASVVQVRSTRRAACGKRPPGPLDVSIVVRLGIVRLKFGHFG